MPARACVFVDGENFRHSILKIFDAEFNEAEYLPRRADWEAFFDHIVSKANPAEDVRRLRTYWYVTQYVDFDPHHLPNPDHHADDFTAIVKRNKACAREIAATPPANLPVKLKQIFTRLQSHERDLQQRFRVWTNVQDGIAGKHTAVEFRRAGAITYNLYRRSFGQEKCVDVKLAVDLLILQDIYDYAIIVSGDQDYVPAVQRIKDHGKRVINVSFQTRSGTLLPGGARRLNHVTDDNIVIPYDELNGFLKIATSAPRPIPAPATTPAAPPLPPPPSRAPLPLAQAIDAILTPLIERLLDNIPGPDLSALKSALEHSNTIPADIDRRLILGARTALSHNPDSAEKSRARALFRQKMRGTTNSPPP